MKSLLFSAALVAASPLSIATIHKDAAPILSTTNAEVIEDSYMIVFKEHVTTDGAAEHHSWVQDLHTLTQESKFELRKRSQFPIMDTVFEGLKHTFHIPGNMLGYSGHFDEETIEAVRRHPDVAWIEKDSVVKTMGSDDPTVEKGSPWGLARISHRKSLGFSTFDKYLYTADGGEGVDAYIVDTGTNYEHEEFEGRASWGKTIPANDEDEDGNGHGTHCSGTVAGKKFGVAKKANIIAVKVLRSNGSGSMSDVVKGVEWAATQHIKKAAAAKKDKKKGFKGSVANMSLGGGKSPTLDKAVNAAVDNGLHFAVAAGNDNADSCNYSPAAAEKAVTVGASTLADERAYFSNFGKCNDIFAPGLNILSSWIGSKHAVNTISGTSMASPHVAGLLAYFLSLQPEVDSAFAVAQITPAQLKKDIISIGTRNSLTDVPSSTENVLIFNGAGSRNYTDIIKKGSYDAKAVVKHTTLNKVEEHIEETVEKIAAKLDKLLDKIAH